MRLAWALAALSLWSTAGCRAFTGDDDDGATPTPVVNVTFNGGVLPAIAAHDCANSACHDDVNPAGQLALGGVTMAPNDVYNAILEGGLEELSGGTPVVVTTNAAISTLVTKPLEGSGVAHAGGKQLSAVTSTGYRIFVGWIEAGAAND